MALYPVQPNLSMQKLCDNKLCFALSNGELCDQLLIMFTEKIHVQLVFWGNSSVEIILYTNIFS